MSLASEIWNWQEGERLYSRITTNVGRTRLLARLSALGLLTNVQSIQAYFGDRVCGGSGYEIVWKSEVRLPDISRVADL